MNMLRSFIYGRLLVGARLVASSTGAFLSRHIMHYASSRGATYVNPLVRRL
jgi:hypothetical protein